MVKGRQIALLDENGTPVTMTGGTFKSLPTWSKDGRQIAFIEETDQAVALAKLDIIDTNGTVLSSVPIKPAKAREVRSGMRFVERLQWLGDHSLAVSGTLNPSTTEYEVIDMQKRTLQREFFDDGFGAAFSPNGEHYAYVSGQPHFTPSSEAVPTLIIDDRSVFSDYGNRLQFTGTPQWSQDNRSVAAPIINPTTGQRAVLLWHEGNANASVLGIPNSAGSSAAPFWYAGALYLSSQQFRSDTGEPVLTNAATDSWVLTSTPLGVRTWLSVPAGKLPDELFRAEALRRSLAAQANTLGGRSPDFWCGACELNLLPRRSGGSD
jgi:hypothetical protein